MMNLPAGNFAEENSPYLSVERVTSLLGVTNMELAKLIGVARNTLGGETGRSQA